MADEEHDITISVVRDDDGAKAWVGLIDWDDGTRSTLGFSLQNTVSDEAAAMRFMEAMVRTHAGYLYERRVSKG